MTTITREHLELAAKAAGYELNPDWHGEGDFLFLGEGLQWRPHRNPLDAWRLAAACKMCVNFRDGEVAVFVKSPMDGMLILNLPKGGNEMEAVTLAASEIGRAMG